MNNKSNVPSAWDDDWEFQADNHAEAGQEVKFSRAERLAKHAETNRNIWKSAEEPETFHFLAARDNVPLKSEFKPALKVLSRKPTPIMIEQIDPVTGSKKLKQEDDEIDVEQNDQPSREQLRLKAKREREEKQRKYDEARARILGSPSRSSPRDTTGHKYLNTEASKPFPLDERKSMNVQDTSNDGLKLIDPNSILDSMQESISRNRNTESPRSTTREDKSLIREPRGPDANGKPGFSFNRKNGK